MIAKLPLCVWPPRQSLTILVFHRVLSAPDPLRPGDPDMAQFGRWMRLIAKGFSVLPLIEAVNLLDVGRLPRRACCITFDDGYADNLTVALPILEQLGLPFTVFVATDYLDGGRMFNDAVIDAIRFTELSMLDLRHLQLGLHPLRTDAERLSAVSAILSNVKFRDPRVREAQVAEIVRAAECGSLPPDIMLTSGQLRELSRRGVEIGGHTAAHAIVATLGDREALGEMTRGKRRLEALIDRPVTSFAYPNGRPGRDYQPRHVEMVRAAGFERAVSTRHGVCDRATDRLQLPRIGLWCKSNMKQAAQLTRTAWSIGAA